MTNVVPMFPLPGVFLFPGQVMPLHVFEPRYRQMIEDLLDGPGRLVMATILEDQTGPETDDSPAVLPVAGLGEIWRHEKLPDGRFKVLLFGMGRVRIREAPSDRLYRQVEWEVWQEDPPGPEHVEDLKLRLIEAIRRRTGFSHEKLEGVSATHLVDALAQCLRLPQSRMAEIFTEPLVQQRAEQVLEADDEDPPGSRGSGPD